MTLAPSPRTWLAAALLLPLAAFAWNWGDTYRLSRSGEEWLIPIQGYDPRDLLRGHYVQYRYDWPVAEPNEDESRWEPAYASALCVLGEAPHIRSVRALSALPGRSRASDDKDCAIVLRATLGARREVRGLDSGIFYASQTEAITLSRRLADPKLQGLVRVRVRPDGVMRPVALEFRPRPAR
ncbi:GDYXXLXY domain-containing protein [Sphingobium sp. YR768]|uniref:GDYXXLXY domain-containing protein n=1 Tax=Sphingobium sp. YR768 TaxID=1884365 RepID=UPI0008D7600F|nr:GDYXXLXY domain-containing protein [Sphingobium sp. YR768]SER63020.1 Uncharacterized membrane-anchored protein [Sphingobium sp. YR768]